VRIGPFTLGNLIWILGILLILAVLLYVDLTHDVTSATVLDKREQIERNVTTASWKRNPEALVTYTVDGRPYQRWITLDVATYDATQAGEQINVRYVPINPSWSRLASQSTFSALVQRVDLWQSFTWLVLAGGVVFLIFQHRKTGIKQWWLRPRSAGRQTLVIVAMILWVQIVVAGYFPPPQPGISDSQRAGMAEATVRDVTVISQVGGGTQGGRGSLPIGLPQGFERVELVFTPEGWVDPVVAVDEVDEGSAGEIVAGATVPVSYAPDNPRDARMDTGSRSHHWKNPVVIQGLIGVFAAVVILAPVAARAARISVAGALEQRGGR
jgi:hypothetical protein